MVFGFLTYTFVFFMLAAGIGVLVCICLDATFLGMWVNESNVGGLIISTMPRILVLLFVFFMLSKV